ncbi:hypothetical protein GCM10023189_58970 [Nibrella saemangeumensis]|uniref:GAF domain-containing protein n=1 Tax=Nibrella saemangeumensis TaxID=1084526 RepID=A0ABP8NS14_9BACT
MTSEIVETTVLEALQMLEEGVARPKILAHLVHAAELASGNDSVSSILVLDSEGLLRNGASPGLPYDYLTAIDGLKPNARVGTCAAAAATGSMVITSDFLQGDKWAELRHLPLSIGFVSAWSTPIKNYDGKVLGTFGTYFREKRQPSQAEIDTINALALAAARVLDYSS